MNGYAIWLDDQLSCRWLREWHRTFGGGAMITITCNSYIHYCLTLLFTGQELTERIRWTVNPGNGDFPVGQFDAQKRLPKGSGIPSFANSSNIAKWVYSAWRVIRSINTLVHPRSRKGLLQRVKMQDCEIMPTYIPPWARFQERCGLKWACRYERSTEQPGSTYLSATKTDTAFAAFVPKTFRKNKDATVTPLFVISSFDAALRKMIQVAQGVSRGRILGRQKMNLTTSGKNVQLTARTLAPSAMPPSTALVQRTVIILM